MGHPRLVTSSPESYEAAVQQRLWPAPKTSVPDGAVRKAAPVDGSVAGVRGGGFAAQWCGALLQASACNS